MSVVFVCENFNNSVVIKNRRVLYMTNCSNATITDVTARTHSIKPQFKLRTVFWIPERSVVLGARAFLFERIIIVISEYVVLYVSVRWFHV